MGRVEDDSEGDRTPAAAAGSGASQAPGQGAADASKVGRNDPCPCGSGIKYKKCHGK